MKNPISLKMEARPRRVFAILLAIPLGVIGITFISGFVIHFFGDDKTVRIGMSAERVREILGEPDQIATLNGSDGKLREDWWYAQPRVRQKSDVTQLTFESGRLVSNHSKDRLPE
jgi:hypothetical protein